MATCDICAETITKEQRKQVNCPGCQTVQCRACVRKYLLTTIDDPHCMACKIGWDREQLVNAVGPTFMNKEYKTYRGTILMDRGRARIPEVQEYAIAYRDVSKVEQERAEINRQYNLAVAQVMRGWRPKIDEVNGRLAALQRIVGRHGRGTGTARAEFIHKCASGNCEGFLSSAWKCRVCENYTCNKCGQYLTDRENHTCDEEDVATFALVRKECKPCPKCATQIYKIEGCDQMWCTQCNTAFSWSTGLEVNGAIHNPHYFAWMRQRNRNGEIPRQPGDGPCGAITPRDLSLAFQSQRVRHGANGQAFNFYRLISEWRVHVTHVDIRQADAELRNLDNKRRELLARYIIKEITRDEYIRSVLSWEKKEQFNRELLGLLRTFVDVLGDQGMQFLQADQETKLRLFDEGRAFVKYIYGQLTHMGRVYGYKVRQHLRPNYHARTVLDLLGDPEIKATWA